jgi:hydroxypyruvate reductase
MTSGETAAFVHMRDLARQVFLEAIQEISIPRIFGEKVEYSRGMLRVEQDLYDLTAYSRVLVIAMGKAAHTMLESLIAQTGPTLEGIVVCSEPPRTQQPGFRYFLGGHPFPTEESVRGARAILKYVSGLDEHALTIYLISGGASAMVEVPRDEEVSLADLIATYRVLVHSGATIGEINAIRKHLSAIKGGRLAQAAFPARQVSIMVSDVPENSLDALASGPTMPDASTEADCYRIAEASGMLPQFPESVRRIFEEHALEETPKADDPVFVHSRWWPILSSTSAANAAAKLVSQHGFAVEIDNTPDDWPYDRAADYLLSRLRELRKGVSRAALISAGEVTVKVAGAGGVGGRNQQFALHCAQEIAGEQIIVLSAGTDGIDGNSPAAGAIADGTTVERATRAGLNPNQALAEFDALPLFEKLGDAIVTGPTGNNVRDLRILLAY